MRPGETSGRMFSFYLVVSLREDKLQVALRRVESRRIRES